MAAIGRNVTVDLSQPGAVLALARSERVTLTVVGPELPLSVGVGDLFRGAGDPIGGARRRFVGGRPRPSFLVGRLSLVRGGGGAVGRAHPGRGPPRDQQGLGEK